MSVKLWLNRILVPSSSRLLCRTYYAAQEGIAKTTAINPLFYKRCESNNQLQNNMQQNVSKESTSSIFPVKYILPTSQKSVVHNKTILDPLSVSQLYHLPTNISLVKEKFSPAWQKIIPIEAPSVDSSTKKIANPWLVDIRKKKMKKHKLKKLRKKMIFLNRKLTQAKKRKKEKELVLYEKEWDKLADEFNAEAFVVDQIEEAKKGKWSVDVIADWKNNTAQKEHLKQ